MRPLQGTNRISPQEFLYRELEDLHPVALVASHGLGSERPHSEAHRAGQ